MNLLYILLVLLVITRACGELAERVRQPALVGEVIAGVVLGIVIRQFSGQVPVLAELPDNEVFAAITDLGIFFLMLLGGIELNHRRVAEASRKAAVVAVGGFLVPFALGFGMAWFALPASSLKVGQALFVGTALAITAVPVAVKILMDLGKLQSRVGQTIISAAVVDDVLSLILLAVLTAVIQQGEAPGIAALGTLALKIVLFFAITVSVGRFLVPILGRFVTRVRVPEFEFSILLIGALAYGLLAEVLGMHFILGPLLAGLFFTRTTVDRGTFEDVRMKVSGITTGFLAPLFFASIGIHVSFGAVTGSPLFLLALLAIAFAGKLVGAGLPALLMGFSRREAASVGMGMSVRGAVELIIADIALRAGLFTAPDPPPPIVANLFSAVVLIAVITTLAPPILLRRWLRDAPAG